MSDIPETASVVIDTPSTSPTDAVVENSTDTAEKVEAEVKVEEPEVKAEETPVDAVKTEEPEAKVEDKPVEVVQNEVKTQEPKDEEVEPVVVEVKPEEPKAEVKPEEPKVEIKKEELKPVEVKKWQSDFTTTKPSIVTTTTTTTTPTNTTTKTDPVPKWKSEFSTSSKPMVSLTPTPTPSLSKAASTASTSSYSPSATPTAKPASSHIQQRASAWATNANATVAPPKQTDFARQSVVSPASTPSHRASVFSYSQTTPLSAAQTQTNAFDKRSTGTSTGSLANLMGNSLGSAHKGTFTGLTRVRQDAAEERARQEQIMDHKNKGANTALQTQMKNAIAEANEVRAGRPSVVQSVNFLAQKLDKAESSGAKTGTSAFSKAKLGPNNTNTDGTAVVGDWVEPATSR